MRNTYLSTSELGFFGGMFLRLMGPYPAGYVHEGHEHYTDHITLLVSGAVDLDWRGRTKSGEERFIARDVRGVPRINPLEVWADCHHRFTALEDNTMWVCAFREPDTHREVGVTPAEMDVLSDLLKRVGTFKVMARRGDGAPRVITEEIDPSVPFHLGREKYLGP